MSITCHEAVSFLVSSNSGFRGLDGQSNSISNLKVSLVAAHFLIKSLEQSHHLFGLAMMRMIEHFCGGGHRHIDFSEILIKCFGFFPDVVSLTVRKVWLLHRFDNYL